MFAQFVFENIHFALGVFSALVFFATGWLFLDSYKLSGKRRTILFRSIGFFLLSIVSAYHATSLQINIVDQLVLFSKILALLLIIISFTLEPVLPIPKYTQTVSVLFVATPLYSGMLIAASAILFLFLTATYSYKSIRGLDKQLKPLVFGFLFISLSEFVNISSAFKQTPVVFWAQLFSDYSPLWIISHTLEFIGIIIICIWMWGYIRFRLQVQLFILSISVFLAIFLSSTVLFTFLLLRNIEQEALAHLQTDVKVLQYSLENHQEISLANAQSIASDPMLIETILKKNTDELYNIALKYLLGQNTNFLTITSKTGEVLMRAENKEKIGDNIRDDEVVKSALLGQKLSTAFALPGFLTPEIQIKAAVPIVRSASSSSELVGTVITGFIIDNNFVDGVKTLTGLDAAVFSGKVRSATTFLAPDGKSRLIGASETNKTILKRVLEEGHEFAGSTQVVNQPFYAAYAPLKAYNNKTIGMLFVGKLQQSLLATAQDSIRLTFLGSVILMILSLIPAYFISRFIQQQIEA